MAKEFNIARVWLNLKDGNVIDEMQTYLAARMAGANTAMELGLAYGIYKLSETFASLEPEDWDAVIENLCLSQEAAMEQLVRLVAQKSGEH